MARRTPENTKFSHSVSFSCPSVNFNKNIALISEPISPQNCSRMGRVSLTPPRAANALGKKMNR